MLDVDSLMAFIAKTPLRCDSMLIAQEDLRVLLLSLNWTLSEVDAFFDKINSEARESELE